MLTLFSMTKIWSGVFWGAAEDEPRHEPRASGVLGGPWLMVLATAALAAGSIAVSVAAGPLYDLAERAAADLLDSTGYRDAVLGGRR